MAPHTLAPGETIVASAWVLPWSAGVALVVADQTPSTSSTSTARICTSYSVPLVRPVMAYCNAPDVQALSSMVQLASSVSSAVVSM